jgi:predicted transcriptional regulator
LLRLAALIVSAHTSNNPVRGEALPDIVRSVYAALSGASEDAPAAAMRQEPAVPVKKSVFPDYIVCLEDGKKMKMLKRHLRTSYNMTPDEYRQKWGLSASYPMVAPDYAAHRSAMAKQIGLGRKAGPGEEPDPVSVTHVPEGLTGKRASRKREAA